MYKTLVEIRQRPPKLSEFRYPYLQIGNNEVQTVAFEIPRFTELISGALHPDLVDIICQSSRYRSPIIIQTLPLLKSFKNNISWFVHTSWGALKEGEMEEIVCMEKNKLKTYPIHNFINYNEFISEFSSSYLFGIWHSEEEYLVIDALFKYDTQTKSFNRVNPDSSYESNLIECARKDSRSPTKLELQEDLNNQIIEIEWSSSIDLQLSLKKMIEECTFSDEPIYLWKGSISHFLIIVSTKPNQQVLLVIYNHETVVLNAIERYAKMEKQRIKSINLLAQDIDWLERIRNLKYPKEYYLCLMEKYIEYCSLNPQNELTLVNELKLCKYSLIQSEHLSNTFLKVPEVLSLPDSLLESNPVSDTIIIYWALGLYGSHTKQIYQEIENHISDYECKLTHIVHKNEIKEKIANIRKSEVSQSHQDFQFILMKFCFSICSLEELIESLSSHVDRKLQFCLYLITPNRSEITEFKHEFHSQQVEYNSISTTYNFSLEFLLCTLITVQREGGHLGSDFMAKNLHSISSTYTNFDIFKTIQLYKSKISHGSIKLIEYQSSDKAFIEWEENRKEEIEDQLRMLLGLSYKTALEEDALLAYFIDNLDNLDYEFDMKGIGTQIVEDTFETVPYCFESIVEDSKVSSSHLCIN